jgi:hypothetical protein
VLLCIVTMSPPSLETIYQYVDKVTDALGGPEGESSAKSGIEYENPGSGGALLMAPPWLWVSWGGEPRTYQQSLLVCEWPPPCFPKAIPPLASCAFAFLCFMDLEHATLPGGPFQKTGWVCFHIRLGLMLLLPIPQSLICLVPVGQCVCE